MKNLKDKYEIEDQSTSQVVTLEEKCFDIALSKMDVVYSGRIENILKNLRFLGQHADIMEFVQRMFVKCSIDIVKLVWPHPKFREMAQNIQDKIRKPKSQKTTVKNSNELGGIMDIRKEIETANPNPEKVEDKKNAESEDS